MRRVLMFLFGLLCGTAVGAMLAGLMTPRSGDETRELVRERGLELKGRAEEMVTRAQQIATETVARVRESAPGGMPTDVGGSAV